VVFLGWMVLGLALYGGYGRRRSRLNGADPTGAGHPDAVRTQ
jgi:hypothetical protein